MAERDGEVTPAGSIMRNDTTSTLKRRLEQLEQDYWRRTVEALDRYLEGRSIKDLNRSQKPNGWNLRRPRGMSELLSAQRWPRFTPAKSTLGRPMLWHTLRPVCSGR